MLTDINNEDRPVQQTFAAHLEKALGWESVYAYNTETLGPHGTLGRTNERHVALVGDLLLPRLMNGECAVVKPRRCRLDTDGVASRS
ncbi:MAG: hypothetical protein ACT4QB_09610 [Gammaproteobacteria bacterium]